MSLFVFVFVMLALFECRCLCSCLLCWPCLNVAVCVRVCYVGLVCVRICYVGLILTMRYLTLCSPFMSHKVSSASVFVLVILYGQCYLTLCSLRFARSLVGGSWLGLRK
jgi:hypothetical protein